MFLMPDKFEKHAWSKLPAEVFFLDKFNKSAQNIVSLL